MFLADRYIKGECPKCGAKDQYGDACENCSSVYSPTDLKNPYSTLSGATPVMKELRALFLQALRRRLRGLPARLDRPAAAPAAAGRQQGARMAGRRRRQGAGRLGHLARRALLRHPDPRCARQVLLRLARRADRLPRQLQSLLREGGRSTSRPSLPTRTPNRCISSARTSSTFTPCSGRRCSSSPARTTRCRPTSSCTASSTSPARRCRRAAAPGSRRCAISS